MKGSHIKNIKLIDFGFAIFIEEIKEDSSKAGTVNFMAPEILQGKLYGTQSDVFSLGVILYFMLSGELPFYSEENEIVVKKIVEGDYDMHIVSMEQISDGAKDLISKMLKSDPSERINIQEALNHDWVLNKEFQAQK